MQCFVTGASGFIGAHLAQELCGQGHAVRILIRPQSELRGLEGLPLERVQGDLADRAGLERALRGCDWCFHVAASYHLWLRDYAPMYRANVDGTRAVLEAAAAAGCARIIYTSTVGCIGQPASPGVHREFPDEATPVNLERMVNPYKKSKWQAEIVAREVAARGAPVVIVNPTAPVGPGDYRPTPTGKVIVDFMKGAMPAYLDTGMNWVHVRDVALGHILAAERGRLGERYILGHADGNWTLKQMLDILAEITGRPSPRVRIPYALAWTVAMAGEAWASLSGRPPAVPIGGVRMARHRMHASPAKAIRELGLPQTPPRQALAEAVQWFTEHGYVR